MFHDARCFPIAGVLEAHWHEIRAEFEAVRDRATLWPEAHNYTGEWLTFPIFGFPHGEPIPERVALCPRTADLVVTHAPGHGVAGFSILRGGTVIRPHRGFAGPHLRCHLPLVVPAGDVALSVEGETRGWQAGRALVFDDRVMHEAWNRTAEDRAVLLVDFLDPRPDGP